MEEGISPSTGFMKKVVICIVGLLVVAAIVAAVFARPSDSSDETVDAPAEQVSTVDAEQSPF